MSRGGWCSGRSRRSEGGELVLRYPDGRGRRFGDGHGPSIVVEVRGPTRSGASSAADARGLRRVLRRRRLGLRRSRRAVLAPRAQRRGRGRPSVLRRLYRVRSSDPTARSARRQPRREDNIHAHYDLGNDLFELMLDPTMAYSCAYWERTGMTLEEAQRAKFRHVCDKLVLGPDDHVLEIGCGWGGLRDPRGLRDRLPRHGGDDLADPGRARAGACRCGAGSRHGRDRRAGLPARRGAVLADRLDRDDRGDRPRGVRHVLRDASTGCSHRTAGRACVQTIGVAGRRFERYRRPPDWIQQTIFPGSLLPSLEASPEPSPGRGCRSTASRRSGSGTRERCESGERTSSEPSIGSAGSATTSGSCGSGASTSHTVRPASRYARSATCNSCSAIPRTRRCRSSPPSAPRY